MGGLVARRVAMSLKQPSATKSPEKDGVFETPPLDEQGRMYYVRPCGGSLGVRGTVEVCDHGFVFWIGAWLAGAGAVMGMLLAVCWWRSMMRA